MSNSVHRTTALGQPGAIEMLGGRTGAPQQGLLEGSLGGHTTETRPVVPVGPKDGHFPPIYPIPDVSPGAGVNVVGQRPARWV